MSAPVVTDHAVVRFLQRAFARPEQSIGAFWASGVDVDAVRDAIAEAVTAGVENGAPGVTWENVRFILRGPIVVTVLTREQFYSTAPWTVFEDRALRREVEGAF